MHRIMLREVIIDAPAADIDTVTTFWSGALDATPHPVPGEPFVFTQFSGEPQCFLTEAQLNAELGRVGFVRDPSVPFHEYNLPKPGTLSAGKAPVIYEAAFRRET